MALKCAIVRMKTAEVRIFLVVLLNWRKNAINRPGLLLNSKVNVRTWKPVGTHIVRFIRKASQGFIETVLLELIVLGATRRCLEWRFAHDKVSVGKSMDGILNGIFLGGRE